MLKSLKENIDKVIGVAAAVLAVVGSIRAELPWHATSIVVVCLVLALFLLFYPWRFPKWAKVNNSKPDDDFYPVMKWGWIGLITLAVLVGLVWPATNFVWVKSPDILAERMQEAHLDLEQDLKMTRDGVWDAKLMQTNPPVPEIVVALLPLDKNRRPQPSEVRQCVPAIHALRAAFGELSSYSRDIRLVMIMVLFLGLGFAGAERMHEARLKAEARKRATAARKAPPKS